MAAGGRRGSVGADVRPIPRTSLPRHQAGPHRQPAALPGACDQPVEQRPAVRAGAEPGLRVSVSARHLLRDRSPAGSARLGHSAAVVGGVAHGRLLGPAAGSRGAGRRRPVLAGGRRRGVRAVTTGADHTRVDLVGNLADDAGAVGAAAHDPGAAGDFWPLGARAGRPSRAGGGADGRGQRHRDAGRLPAGGDLVGLSPAESVVVALHRVVAVGDGLATLCG